MGFLRLAEVKWMNLGLRNWVIAVLVSFFLHVFVCMFFVVGPNLKSNPHRLPAVIDVDLMSVRAAPEKPKKIRKTGSQKVQPRAVRRKKTVQKHKKKAVLNKKKKVIVKKSSPKAFDNAVDRLRKKLTQPPSAKTAMDKRLQEMREEMAHKKTIEDLDAPEPKDNVNPVTEAEKLAIARYVSEVKVTIQENWAFSSSLIRDKKKYETRLTIRVMPDGRIVEAKVTEKSGSDYLDGTAAMAVQKSNPLFPFPAGFQREFLLIDIGFSPESK